MLFLNEHSLREVDPLELNGKEMDEAMAQAFTSKKQDEEQSTPSAADLQNDNVQEEEITSVTTEWKRMKEEAEKIEKEKKEQIKAQQEAEKKKKLEAEAKKKKEEEEKRIKA